MVFSVTSEFRDALIVGVILVAIVVLVGVLNVIIGYT